MGLSLDWIGTGLKKPGFLVLILDLIESRYADTLNHFALKQIVQVNATICQGSGGFVPR
jgi:hypothetical protein